MRLINLSQVKVGKLLEMRCCEVDGSRQRINFNGTRFQTIVIFSRFPLKKTLTGRGKLINGNHFIFPPMRINNF